MSHVHSFYINLESYDYSDYVDCHLTFVSISLPSDIYLWIAIGENKAFLKFNEILLVTGNSCMNRYTS